MKFKRFITLSVLIVFTACAPQAPATPSVGDVQTAIAQTQAAATEVSFPTSEAPATEAEPETEATSLPPTRVAPLGEPLSGRINAAFLNLRKGPSTLHDVSAAYVTGDEFVAIGRIPTNDWVQVQIEDGDTTNIGWMSTVFLDIDGEVEQLPIATIPESLQLRGKVSLTSGGPVTEIGIAAIYRTGATDLRTDTTTGQNGEWTIYLPPDLLGVLDVQIVSVGCNSSIMAGGCTIGNFFELIGRAFVTIPQQELAVFEYSPGETQIAGVVKNKAGDSVAGVLVVGERDDGAEALATSGIDGFFSLPGAPGNWNIYAVVFEPRREGESVLLNVTDEIPEEITVLTP
jgi:hypothetical protein